MVGEAELVRFLAGGGKLDAPENASPRYRGELLRLMAIFVDSEMAGAAGFADCINLGPGLRERRNAARIVHEKLGHAAKVLHLMERFGANSARYERAHSWADRLARETDLGTRRIEGDMRLNVFHYPIIGWVDAVVMNVLMGRATAVQLDELTRCSYQPLAACIQDILPEEIRHADMGEVGLREALARGADASEVQRLVDYWFPRVADTFGSLSSRSIEVFRKYGLRQRGNQELLEAWHSVVADSLRTLGLHAPTGPLA